MGKKTIRFSDQFRKAVNESGLSRHGICKVTGIDEGYFSRFMADKEGLGLKYVDAVAERLRLELLGAKKGKKPLKLSAQVRRKMADMGMSCLALHRKTGVGYNSLLRFMAGSSTLRLKALDDLTDLLKLELIRTGVPEPIPRGKPGRPRKYPLVPAGA